MVETLAQADATEQFFGAFRRLARRNPGDARGETNVFQSCQFRQQMIRLKHKTHAAIAEIRQLALREIREFLAAKNDFARIRCVESADEM